MSRVAVSDWLDMTTAVAIPASATEVWWTMAGNMNTDDGVPIVGGNGRIAYVTITYDAAGVYTISLNGGSNAVADVVADGLANEAAVLDHLYTDLVGIYGSITFTRVTLDGADTLVISSNMSRPTIQADCTGGSATLDIDATAESAEQIGVGAVQSIDGTSTGWVMTPKQSGSQIGGVFPLVPGLSAVIASATPDTSSPPDTDANNATVTLITNVWCRFYREVR